jgi:hypothetical protein
MQSILPGLLLHLSPGQGSTNLVTRQVHVKGSFNLDATKRPSAIEPEMRTIYL